MFGLRTFVFCALVCAGVDAARILALFPTPSISHQVPFRPITQELARRGHEVVVITTDPAFPKGQAPANLTEIDVHDVSYGAWREVMTNMKTGRTDGFVSQFLAIGNALMKIFEEQVKVPEVREIIDKKKGHFDLVLVETCFRQALVFAHIYNVPVISMSSLGGFFDAFLYMGAPVHPVLYPETFARRVYNLTLKEKIYSYYHTYTLRRANEKLEAGETDIARKIFGADLPDIRALTKYVVMLFLNVHPVWEGNRPVPPSVVHIGGIHQKPQKELPKELKQYLDSSKHGVIYVSFGSNVDTSVLPAEKVKAMINVFSRLPYDVLWKWNQDELPGRTENIRISKWLPQSDLLRHPKIKLFVMQGGLQSTDETIVAGVPVVGIPIFGDQWYNVEKHVHHGMGKQVNLVDLTEETFMSAVTTVIEDKSYRENVVRFRALMHDQPQSPLERAVWWTEHVIRHGGAHLRAPAAGMDWYEYYDVKLVLLVLSAAAAAIALVSIVLWNVLKFILGQSSRSKVKRS